MTLDVKKQFLEWLDNELRIDDFHLKNMGKYATVFVIQIEAKKKEVAAKEFVRKLVEAISCS